MRAENPTADPLVSQLKNFLVDSLGLRDLKPDRIADDEPLLGGRIGLDSLDAAEFAMYLEERFGISIHDFRAAFASIRGLAGYIRGHAPASPADRQSLLPFELSAQW